MLDLIFQQTSLCYFIQLHSMTKADFSAAQLGNYHGLILGLKFPPQKPLMGNVFVEGQTIPQDIIY
jgi:hypothetical protein